jgi:hypothetical protein
LKRRTAKAKTQIDSLQSPGIPQPLPSTVREQHIEQMYQLADIFASIFDALHDPHDDDIATPLGDGLTSDHEDSLQ